MPVFANATYSSCNTSCRKRFSLKFVNICMFISEILKKSADFFDNNDVKMAS